MKNRTSKSFEDLDSLTSNPFWKHMISQKFRSYEKLWRLKNNILTLECYPRYIYKFYSYNSYNIDALLDNYLFLSHPFLLNDALDTSIEPLNPNRIDEKMWQKIHASCPKIENQYYPGNNSYYNLEMNEDMKNNCEGLRNHILSSIASQNGIVSFTSGTNLFNELMWSHYANEKGFVVEFDTKRLLTGLRTLNDDYCFSLFFPIDYKIECIHLKDYPDATMLYLYSALKKGMCWEYEKEWRLICFKNKNLGVPFYAEFPENEDAKKKQMEELKNRHITYDPQAINRIIVGKKFWNFTNTQRLIEQDKRDPYLRRLNVISTEDKGKSFLDVLKFLKNKHSDHLFISGVANNGSKDSEDNYELHRSFQRFTIEEIENNIIVIRYFLNEARLIEENYVKLLGIKESGKAIDVK